MHNRVALFNKYAPTLLSRINLQNVSVTASQIDPEFSRLSSLSLRYGDHTKTCLFEASDAALTYDFETLKLHRLKKIEIANLKIDCKLLTTTSPETKNDPKAKIEYADISQFIPFDSMVVSKLTLRLTLPQKDSIELDLSASLTSQSEKLSTVAEIKGTNISENLVAGIPYKNLKSKFEISIENTKPLKVSVSKLSFDIFGGAISANRFEYFPFKKSNKLGINIKGVDIKKLLAFYPQDKVEATGLIDGYLPLTIYGDGLKIEKGKIQTRSSGIIRYNSQLNPDPNSQLANVNEILKNFHYDTLSSSVDYSKDGVLLLGLYIEGKSPNVYKGRQINFSLNIEDNILKLIQSINMINNIGDTVKQGLSKNK